MITLISLFVVILVSITVVRIGAVALEMTGLSKDVAMFQAQSAFTGVGFTTRESEYVVMHPVRRKIVMILMFIGNAGIVSAMATLVLTFVGQSAEEMRIRLLWLLLGLVAIYLFGRSKMIDRWMRSLIRKALERFSSLRIYDYEQLLGLSKGYSIGVFEVGERSWLKDMKLRDLKLDMEGIIILAIYRRRGNREVYIGAPRGDTFIRTGDRLICYGPDEAIKRLSHRLKGKVGDEQHIKAMDEEADRRKAEEKEIMEMEKIESRAQPEPA